MTGLCGVVLAAGLGTRLRPLTDQLPKPLCPVGNRPLLDLAVERVEPVVDELAVNVHHHRDRMLAHLDGRDIHISVEEDEPLGTAGAVGLLREWIDGRAVLIANSDAYGPPDLDRLVEGWDGTTIRLLVSYEPAKADFGGVWRFAGASLHPWEVARELPAEPAGLYEVCWERALVSGRVELVPTAGLVIDCGTPADYLAANLVSCGVGSVISPTATVTGTVLRSVVGEEARVTGSLTSSVVWPGARVDPEEHLEYAIRTPDGTTLHPFSRPT